MKIRTDFVTNSSSSCFVFWGFYSKELVDYLLDLVKRSFVYPWDYDLIDAENLSRLLLSDKQRTGNGVVDALRFFPYSSSPKVGFQIEGAKSVHSTPLDALMAYVNLGNLPGKEAERIRGELENLALAADKAGRILRDRGMGMTDGDFKDHFSEKNIDCFIRTGDI